MMMKDRLFRARELALKRQVYQHIDGTVGILREMDNGKFICTISGNEVENMALFKDINDEFLERLERISENLDHVLEQAGYLFEHGLYSFLGTKIDKDQIFGYISLVGTIVVMMA